MTLEDLKLASGRVPPTPTDNHDDLTWKHYHYHRAEAWKAAFEWQAKFPAYCGIWNTSMFDEHRAGMRLIREKLS